MSGQESKRPAFETRPRPFGDFRGDILSLSQHPSGVAPSAEPRLGVPSVAC